MTSTRISDQYYTGITNHNRTSLSKAITLLESNKAEHKKLALELVQKCYPLSGNSIRIGITGAPGAGKSTFIESLGNYLLNKGKKIAVLAVDPSSKKSSGSILGDKTRMEKLASNDKAFIRPSPSAGELGGIGTATREAIILCEAAGYDIIIVETVGVGQSEIDVQTMTDICLVITIAGSGDELQGIKRGIMEMADIVLINKSDILPMKSQISTLKSQITNALHLFPPSESRWQPRVLVCSSVTGEGIDTAWKTINEYFSLVRKNNYLFHKRKEQLKHWFKASLDREIISRFYGNLKVKTQLKKRELEVVKGKINPAAAVQLLLNDAESSG